MLLKTIQDENFQDYKKPAMLIATAFCDWKCCKELGMDTSICQNSPTAKIKTIEVSADQIFRRYFFNPITKAIIFGGLEPMLQFEEVLGIIRYFRQQGCNDDFVLYTGYYPEEIQPQINKLKQFPGIIIKFGRYIPEMEHHLDNTLGIPLASSNQYAVKIS